MQSRPVLVLALALAAGGLGGCDRATADTTTSPAPLEDLATRTARLDALYAEYWEARLALEPLRATALGDTRYNDQLPDTGTEEYRAQLHAFNKHWLERVEAIGSEDLAGQDRLNYRIFVDERQRAIQSERFPSWMMPVDQMAGLASRAVLLGSGRDAQPFSTVADYEAWLRRAARVASLMDTEIANMRAGIEANVVQPRVVMEQVLPQLAALIAPTPEESPFWAPVDAFPEDFSDADRQRLSAAFRTLITEQLDPAIQREHDFIANEYMAHARESVGMDALPDGMAWYAWLVRQHTGSELTPDAIHRIGLDEVARIHGEIHAVMARAGFEGSLQAFFRFMQDDGQFTFESEEALFAHYRDLETRARASVPALFPAMPDADLQIRAMEPLHAVSAAHSAYMAPARDGSRPGVFLVNTGDLPARKRWEAADLFLHEAMPGHHFQLALQQALDALPAFRRFGGDAAFIEGWGLYAEGLGRELDMYADPYDEFGQLQGELRQAIALVVDTGLHSQGWSRDQAVDYMRQNAPINQSEAIAETGRYIARPGQALAYMIGGLQFRTLRTRSEDALGKGFDIRRFHAQVLNDGALPLPLLEEKVDRWIARQKALHSTPTEIAASGTGSAQPKPEPQAELP